MSKSITINTALRIRAALKGQLALHTKRMESSNLWEEGEEPAFTFKEEWDARTKVVHALVELSGAISESNARTVLANGQSLAVALKALDEIKAETALLTKLVTQARTTRVVKTESVETDYETYPARQTKVKKETTWHCVLDERARSAAIEVLQAKFAYLNGLVEASNHETRITVSDDI